MSRSSVTTKFRNKGVQVLRLISALATTEAAMCIGAGGCWLVAAVARKQDQIGTDQPIPIWLNEIASMLGYQGKKDAIRVREKVVAGGWMEYVPPPDGSHLPGHYRALIPDGFLSPSVSQMGNGIGNETGSQMGNGTGSQTGNGRGSQMGNRSGNRSGNLSSLYLIPKPKEGATSVAASSDHEKTKPSSKFDPTSIEIPNALNIPEFRAAWSDWCTDRRERRKPITPTAAVRQIKLLTEMGPATAITSINNSIANGWSGLFVPDDKPARNGTATTAADKPAPKLRAQA